MCQAFPFQRSISGVSDTPQRPEAQTDPPGTAVTVSARAEEEYIAIEVTDQGYGIPEADLVRVFEKFYRGKSKNVRGAGLGLPICRAIVQAHRGTIQALSREGGGTTFAGRGAGDMDGASGRRPR